MLWWQRSPTSHLHHHTNQMSFGNKRPSTSTWELLAAVWCVYPSNPEHAFCCLMTALSLLGKMMRDENKHSHASQKHISRRWHTETSNLYLNASFSVLCGVFQTSHDWQSWKPEPRCGWASFGKRRQRMSLQIQRHRATPGQFKP